MRNALPFLMLSCAVACQGPSDGVVLISDAGSGEVLRVDLATGEVDAHGISPAPSGLAWWGQEVVVTDASTHEVFELDLASGQKGRTLLDRSSMLEEPADAVAFGSQLAVLGNDSRNVVVLAGRQATLLPAPPLRSAHAITCVDDELWVGTEPALRDLGLIVRLDGFTGERLGSFAPYGQLTSAMDLTLGPDGLLYVTDWFSDRVVTYDPASQLPVEVLPLTLDRPIATAFTPSGELLVLEEHRLSRVDEDGLVVLVDGLEAARAVLPL